VTIDQIQDVEVLRTLVKLQLRESERLKAELVAAHAELRDKKPGEAEQLALQLAKIERQHAAATNKLFGQSSERRPKDKPAKAREPQSGHGPRSQPSLPLEVVKHTLPEAERVCTLCQSPMAEWAGQYEESEEIDFVLPKLVMKLHRRQKYRCECGGCIKTAPSPRKLFPGARYSINFALHVAMQKYTNHMPLDRQRRDLRRLGLEVTTSTLWDYLFACYTKLEPVMARLHQHVLSQPVIGMDETTWRLLKAEARGGKTKKWWVWVQRVDDAVYYVLNPSRGADVAKDMLQDYEGVVVADGYYVYGSVQRCSPHIQLAHCWSHARREVLPYEDDPRGARVLRVIQRLYRLEAMAEEKGLSPPELLRWRQRKTRPLLSAFFRWLGEQEIPSTYDLHGALKYIVKRETSLCLFLNNPLVTPDNNATERVIRGVVVGRKNHYGSRSERGTKVAALFYSLVDSAALAGIDPRQYLLTALNAALAGDEIPLPHELAQAATAAPAAAAS